MSVEGNRAEGKRWLRQAKEDVAAAEVLAAAGKYAQACFLCQQAAEKAAKGAAFALDLDPWGHSVARLLAELADRGGERFLALREEGVLLDKFYIPTRYPNGLPELIPQEAYGASDYEAARRAAGRILAACEGTI